MSPVTDQGVNRQRYTVIPRTAIFLRRDDSYLLLKGAPAKRLFANRYNGLGGHVERGEDALSAAQRELREEAGLSADLWLCGTLMIDTGGDAGICLYIFTGEAVAGELCSSPEGLPEWIPFAGLDALPVVEDLPLLLGRIHTMRRGDPPFAARSSYTEDGSLILVFAG